MVGCSAFPGSLGALLTVLLPTAVGATEVLTDRQLDGITAGQVSITTTATATASAEAFARGPTSRTEVATEGFAVRQAMLVVSLERINGDVTVVTSARTNEVDLAFARASARAEGTAARTTCTTDLRLNGPAAVRLVESQRSIAPGMATCLCARFGANIRPD